MHSESFCNTNGSIGKMITEASDIFVVGGKRTNPYILPPIPAQPATAGAARRGSYRAGLAHARLIRGPGAASPGPRNRLSRAWTVPRWVATLVRTARVCLCARGWQDLIPSQGRPPYDAASPTACVRRASLLPPTIRLVRTRGSHHGACPSGPDSDNRWSKQTSSEAPCRLSHHSCT